MEKGKFIVLEGLDYSGKTTLAKRLVEHLNNMGIKTVHASCSDKKNRLTGIVKEHILNAEDGILPSVDTQAMLWAACINDLVDTSLLPAINRGEWVVCERYTLSSRVYQTHSLLTNALTTSIDRRLSPDLTIVLDITPQVHQERAAQRETPADALERVDLDCLNLRRKQYRLEVRRCDNTCLLDSTLPPEELLLSAVMLIGKKLQDA